MPARDGLRARRHAMVVFAHYPASEARVQRQAEALVARGVDVDVLCLRKMDGPDAERPAEVVNGVRVYRLPTTRSYHKPGLARTLFEYLVFFVQAMLALIRLQPRRRYQVVQVHNLPDFLVFAAWFPKLLGARLILDLHDLMPEFFASRTGQGTGSRLARLLIWQERVSCGFADHVIAVTDLWRETLVQRGVPRQKISVVMNVPDDRVFRRAGDRPGRDSAGLHLLYHGSAVHRYGVDLVLKAIALLHDELPDLRCTIHSARGGAYWQELVDLASQLGIEDHVRFSDTILPITELPRLIETADVGLAPYRSDVFTDKILPTKLMEYSALGLPAIATRTEAIQHYFEDTFVEFVDPDDAQSLAAAIRRLYHDPARRAALSRGCDRFNVRYNWATQSADYAALVERLGRPRRADQKASLSA